MTRTKLKIVFFKRTAASMRREETANATVFPSSAIVIGENCARSERTGGWTCRLSIDRERSDAATVPRSLSEAPRRSEPGIIITLVKNRGISRFYSC